jgi:hypothetical protein
LVLLRGRHRLLCLRYSLSLLWAQVHLSELLAERIWVLGWGLSVRGSWCSIRGRWRSVCRRRCPIRWCSRRSISGCCGRTVAWSRWWDTCSSLTARVGSKLVCGARVSVPLLAIRHGEGSGGLRVEVRRTKWRKGCRCLRGPWECEVKL